MENQKTPDHLDAFTKKHIQELSYTKAPKDFTADLMNRIAQEKAIRDIENTPLISGKAWIAIAISLLAILSSPFIFENKSSFTLPKLDLSFLSDFSFQVPSLDLSLSQTTYYCIILFGSLLLFQLFALRSFYQRG